MFRRSRLRKREEEHNETNNEQGSAHPVDPTVCSTELDGAFLDQNSDTNRGDRTESGKKPKRCSPPVGEGRYFREISAMVIIPAPRNFTYWVACVKGPDMANPNTSPAANPPLQMAISPERVFPGSVFSTISPGDRMAMSEPALTLRLPPTGAACCNHPQSHAHQPAKEEECNLISH